jgi:hypothetical protein
MLLLSEGQTGEAREPSKKQCFFGNRGTLDKESNFGFLMPGVLNGISTLRVFRGGSH